MTEINSWEMFDEFNRRMDEQQIIAGLEYLNPKEFTLKYDILRVPHLGATRIIKIGDKLQLPSNSILHLFDSMNTPDEIRDTPEWETNPFIRHETARLAMYHVREPLLTPIETEESYRFPIAQLINHLAKFRLQYPNKFRYVNQLGSLIPEAQALNIVNHNPVWRMMLRNPRLIYLRKLRLTYTSVFNYAKNLLTLFPEKRQFIMIPWGEEVFNKEKFTRTFARLDTNSVQHPNSYHFLMMMEFLLYLKDGCEHSFFKQVPEDLLNKLTFIIGNDKYCIFLTLPTLLTFPDRRVTMYRFLNQLNQLSLLCRETQENASKLAKIVDEVEAPDTITKSALVSDDIVSGVKELILNSDVVKRSQGITQETKTEAVIAQAAEEIPVRTEEVEATPEKHDEESGKTPSIPKAQLSSQTNAKIKRESGKRPVLRDTGTAYAPSQTAVVNPQTTDASSREFQADADKRMREFLQSRKELTPRQRERLEQIGTKYRSIVLEDGQTIGQLLDKDVDISMESITLGDNVVGDKPLDESIRKSSTHAFDRVYLERVFKKQMVSILSSFRAQGLFLVGMTTERVVNPVNDDTYYSCKFMDYRGKTSTVKYRLPNINRFGRFKLDGIESFMQKQRLNTPIVKISPVEVSLSSNYNKARVIRNTAVAHSFYNYIDKLVNSTKSHAKIVYGNALINAPVSYEYSTLCERYESITFHDPKKIKWSLYFNHGKRLEHFGGSEKLLTELENRYGVYMGKSDTHILFIDRDNYVTGYVASKGEDPDFVYNSIAEICKLSLNEGEVYKKQLTEWVMFKNLDINLPAIFVLAYRHGLRRILDDLKLDYTITEARSKVIVGQSTPIAATEDFTQETDLKPVVEQLSDVQYGSAGSRVLTPKECLSRKLGTCWEQALVVAQYCADRQIPYKFCYVDTTDGKTHTFVIAQLKQGWFYVETAWGSHEGVFGPFANAVDAIVYFKKKMHDDEGVYFITTNPDVKVDGILTDTQLTSDKFLKLMGGAVGLAKYKDIRTEGYDVTHFKVNGEYEDNPNYHAEIGMEDGNVEYIITDYPTSVIAGTEAVESHIEPDYGRATDSLKAMLAKYTNPDDPKCEKIAHAIARNKLFSNVLRAPGFQKRSVSWAELWQDVAVDLRCDPGDYAYQSIFFCIGSYLVRKTYADFAKFNCYFSCMNECFTLDKVDPTQVLPDTSPEVKQVPNEEFYGAQEAYDEFGILKNNGDYVYHVSLIDLGETATLVPSRPMFKDTLHENNATKRVCVSSTVFGCLASISHKLIAASAHNRYVSASVYALPVKNINLQKYVSTDTLAANGDVYDVSVTRESWILTDVTMRRAGKIAIDTQLALSVFYNSPRPHPLSGGRDLRTAYVYGYAWVSGRDPQYPSQYDFPIHRCVDEYRHIPNIDIKLQANSSLLNILKQVQSWVGFGNDYFYCLAIQQRGGDAPYFIPIDSDTESYFTTYADLNTAVSELSLLGERFVYVVRQSDLKNYQRVVGGTTGTAQLAHVFKPAQYHYAGTITISSQGYYWTKKNVTEMTTGCHQACDDKFVFARNPVNIGGLPAEVQQLYGVSELINYGMRNDSSNRVIAPNTSTDYILDHHVVTLPKDMLAHGGYGTDWEASMVIAYLSRKLRGYCTICAVAFTDNVVRVFPVINIKDKFYHVETMFTTDTGIHGPFNSIEDTIERVIYRTKKIHQLEVLAIRKNIDFSPYFEKSGTITHAAFLDCCALQPRYFEQPAETTASATESNENVVTEQYLRIQIRPYREDAGKAVATLYTNLDRRAYKTWDDLFRSDKGIRMSETLVEYDREVSVLSQRLMEYASEVTANHPAGTTYVFVNTDQLYAYPYLGRIVATDKNDALDGLEMFKDYLADIASQCSHQNVANGIAHHFKNCAEQFKRNVCLPNQCELAGFNLVTDYPSSRYSEGESYLVQCDTTLKDIDECVMQSHMREELATYGLTLEIDNHSIRLLRDDVIAFNRVLPNDIPLVVQGHTNLGILHSQVRAGLASAEGAGEVRYTPKPGDIAIKFADRVLWFNRYPLEKSLIVAGLDAFKLHEYNLAAFEDKEVYYCLLMNMNKSINYLKGIDSFFDLFIDPITYNILKEMNEPTTPEGLLYRSAQLLSTRDHRPAASSVNYRIRGYEQINAIIYNEFARAVHKWQTNKSRANVFSVNPQAVYLKIATNSAVLSSDMANPLQGCKLNAAMTFAGTGGRSADSFVLEDRRYLQDDIGIMAMDTSDNQKVGMNAQLPLNCQLYNANGTVRVTDGEGLKPADVLSVCSLVFPCSTHDDFKRLNK